MSEYQYYGWQAIDRPLNEPELEQVARLSSHMDQVNPTCVSVTYQWGNFKHNPVQILLKYFDVFLYDSNFGYRRVTFRIPKKLLDPSAIAAYLDDENISLETHGNFHILELSCNEEYDLETIDSDRMLNRLAALREQIIQGDYRALYLTWLKSVIDEEEPDQIEEPPAPDGLNKLDSGLRALIEFFGIDDHLVTVAAGSSPQTESTPEQDLTKAIAKLTRAEMESHLADIVRGESGALSALKKRLAQNFPSAQESKPTRTLAELLQTREKIKKQQQAKAWKETERTRIQKLEALSQHQEEAWAQIESLCLEKRARTYDQAAQLLSDLHELGEYKNQGQQFQKHLALILEQYGKSAAFKERLRRIGLI